MYTAQGQIQCNVPKKTEHFVEYQTLPAEEATPQKLQVSPNNFINLPPPPEHVAHRVIKANGSAL